MVSRSDSFAGSRIKSSLVSRVAGLVGTVPGRRSWFGGMGTMITSDAAIVVLSEKFSR